MRARIVSLATVAVLLASPPALAGGLEGRWRLVEQHYGDGGFNLADPGRPVHLEFRGEGEWTEARIWAGDDASRAVSWPAFVTDRGVLPLLSVEEDYGERGDRVRVRYRVRPAASPGGALVLHVTEEYRVEEAGRALVGRLEVTFSRDGERRGSYVLHRRFERLR